MKVFFSFFLFFKVSFFTDLPKSCNESPNSHGLTPFQALQGKWESSSTPPSQMPCPQPIGRVRQAYVWGRLHRLVENLVIVNTSESIWCCMHSRLSSSSKEPLVKRTEPTKINLPNSIKHNIFLGSRIRCYKTDHERCHMHVPSVWDTWCFSPHFSVASLNCEKVSHACCDMSC